MKKIKNNFVIKCENIKDWNDSIKRAISLGYKWRYNKLSDKNKEYIFSKKYISSQNNNGIYLTVDSDKFLIGYCSEDFYKENKKGFYKDFKFIKSEDYIKKDNFIEKIDNVLKILKN